MTVACRVRDGCYSICRSTDSTYFAGVIRCSVDYGLVVFRHLAALRHPAVAATFIRLVWRQKIPLLLLGTALVTMGWAMSHFWRSNPDLSRTVGADWPAARGGLTRRGAVQEAAGPTVGGAVWSAGRRGEAFYSSPAVVANRVYTVGSKGDRGRIYAFDLDSGRQLWECRPAGFASTFSSPVIIGDLLVCGEGLHHTKMARVICVDRVTGKLKWTFQTNGHVECTPAVEQGRVYVGAGDDGVYCLELDPAVDDERRLVWHARDHAIRMPKHVLLRPVAESTWDWASAVNASAAWTRTRERNWAG